MRTKEEFIKKYSSYSNDKLLDILRRHYEYNEESLQAAKSVIEDRGISIEEVHEYNADFEMRKRIHEKVAAIPLAIWEKFIFFFIWFGPGFFGNVFGLNYADDGLLKKQKQRRYFSIAGFISFTIVAAIYLIFSVPMMMSFIVLSFCFPVTYFLEHKLTGQTNEPVN